MTAHIVINDETLALCSGHGPPALLLGGGGSAALVTALELGATPRDGTDHNLSSA